MLDLVRPPVGLLARAPQEALQKQFQASAQRAPRRRARGGGEPSRLVMRSEHDDYKAKGRQ